MSSFDSGEIIEIGNLLDTKIVVKLKMALEMILETSNHLAGLYLFSAQDYLILNKLCGIPGILSTEIDELVLSILINITAESENISEQIINTNLMTKLKQIGENSQLCRLRTAQLISNMSRHSKNVYLCLKEQWPLHEIISIFNP